MGITGLEAESVVMLNRVGKFPALGPSKDLEYPYPCCMPRNNNACPAIRLEREVSKRQVGVWHGNIYCARSPVENRGLVETGWIQYIYME